MALLRYTSRSSEVHFVISDLGSLNTQKYQRMPLGILKQFYTVDGKLIPADFIDVLLARLTQLV